MQGGTDDTISANGGELLYRAAGEPKELWYEPEVGHGNFTRKHREEFERRVVQFYDSYLLGQ